MPKSSLLASLRDRRRTHQAKFSRRLAGVHRLVVVSTFAGRFLFLATRLHDSASVYLDKSNSRRVTGRTLVRSCETRNWGNSVDQPKPSGFGLKGRDGMGSASPWEMNDRFAAIRYNCSDS